jgi:hypothetical protein
MPATVEVASSVSTFASAPFARPIAIGIGIAIAQSLSLVFEPMLAPLMPGATAGSVAAVEATASSSVEGRANMGGRSDP